MEFEWDPEKARDNEAKHNVTFREATEAFADPLSSTAVDPDHSLDEERFVIFGKTLGDCHIRQDIRRPVPGRGVHGARW